MTALIVIGCVLSVLLLIACLPVAISVKASDTVKATLRILCFRFSLYPQKKRTVKIKDYSTKAIARRRKKEEKKQKKAQKRQAASDEPQKKEKKFTVSELPELLATVYEVLSTLFSRLGKHLKLKLTRIRITVGGSDPASIALLYGAVSQGVAYLLAVLDEIFAHSPAGKRDVTVNADFLSQKTVCDIDVEAGMRVWQLLATALHILMRYIKRKYFPDSR